ncbi:MAG: deoxyribonuclease V [Blastocatellia bacterium]|nr:deoxyribonuclease V [Blastocatellia bacterium]
MQYRELHAWDLKPSEAIELQKTLQQQVRIEPLYAEVETVAGCDISFNKFSDRIYAGIIVLKLPGLEILERATVVTTVSFPYIPGLLSFRETPALLEVWKRLTKRPDVVMLDGQGLAHPRRFGIACHFGLLTGIPAIGCAKTVLVGKYREPDERAGSYSLMEHKGETVGAAVRTKDRVSPVYVSAGHLIDLSGAIALALRCARGYRVPEPTRQAHLLVNALRRDEGRQK